MSLAPGTPVFLDYGWTEFYGRGGGLLQQVPGQARLARVLVLLVVLLCGCPPWRDTVDTGPSTSPPPCRHDWGDLGNYYSVTAACTTAGEKDGHRIESCRDHTCKRCGQSESVCTAVEACKEDE